MNVKFKLRILFMLPFSCWVLLAGNSVAGENSKGAEKIKDAVDAFELKNQEKILQAEQELEHARNAEKMHDFQAALNYVDKARSVVAALHGPYAKSKLRNIDQYQLSLKAAWGDKLMADARQQYMSGKYDLAMAQAKEAVKIDPNKQDEVEPFLRNCQQKIRYITIKEATNINTIDPSYEKTKKEITILLKEAEIFADDKMYGKARDTLEKVLIRDPYNQRGMSMLNKVYQELYKVADKRRQVEYRDRMQELEWTWSEGYQPSDRSNVVQPPIVRATDTSTLQEKMQRIIFDTLDFEDASITSVITHLNALSKQSDPEGVGVSIVSNLSSNQSVSIPKITMNFDHIPMLEAIRYICQAANLKYKIEEKAVIIGDAIDPMDTRFFKVRASLITAISGSATDAGKLAADRSKFTDKDQTIDLEDTFSGGKSGGGAGAGAGAGGADVTSAVTPGSDGGAAAMPMDATMAGIAPVPGAPGSTVTSTGNATTDALIKYFSDRGITFGDGATIAYDRRAGKLIVKNTYENLRKLEHLLRDLDIQTPLVLIEAKVVEMRQDDLEELGFDWVFSSANDDVHPHWSIDENSQILRNYNGQDFRVINDLKLLPNFAPGSDMNLSLTVNAVDQHTKQEILSAPKVIATSGQTALIKMVEQYYFPESWDDPELSVSTSSVEITPPVPDFGEATDIGIRFEVTPMVSPNNYTISLHLVPQVVAFSGWQSYPVYMRVGDISIGSTEATESKYDMNISMPIISRRDLDTNVKVFDGETIVLGGMLQDEAVGLNDKWPVLGDIPFLGRFFSSQAQQSVKVNLLIFVTARLINSDGVPVREDSLRGLPEFNR